ncbi:MAG: nuclear transport factor 2 family protein [Acidobacteria bacterium]|nr:nuclear transport factor 2 family protein [Acidobacteriota bacterium]
MRKTVLLLAMSALCISAAYATTGDDVAAPLRQFIDAFNKENTAAAYATYAKGEISIVDEFAPHRWSGVHAAQDWASAYEKHAQATGVSDGQVKYGTPTRIERDGDFAYVILPNEYLYKEHGKPMDEKGQITAVLHKEDGAWKIQAWTWSGEKPHAGK